MNLIKAVLFIALGNGVLSLPSSSFSNEVACNSTLCSLQCANEGYVSGYCGAWNSSVNAVEPEYPAQDMPGQCICESGARVSVAASLGSPAAAIPIPCKTKITKTICTSTSTVTVAPTSVCFCCSSPNGPPTGVQGNCDLATSSTCTTPGRTNRICCTQTACMNVP